jgi:transposase
MALGLWLTKLMQMGRPHQFIELTEQDKDFLKAFVSKGESKAIEQNRGRMLLWSDSKIKAKEIATLLGMCYATVTQTLKSYRDEGLESALYDAHRSGAPRKVTPELEAYVTAIACSDCPDGEAKWTIDLLRDEVVRLQVVEKISRSSVYAVLKKANSSLGRNGCGASAR